MTNREGKKKKSLALKKTQPSMTSMTTLASLPKRKKCGEPGKCKHKRDGKCETQYFILQEYPPIGEFARVIAPGESTSLDVRAKISETRQVLIYVNVFLNILSEPGQLSWNVLRDGVSLTEGEQPFDFHLTAAGGEFAIPFELVDTTASLGWHKYSVIFTQGGSLELKLDNLTMIVACLGSKVQLFSKQVFVPTPGHALTIPPTETVTLTLPVKISRSRDIMVYLSALMQLGFGQKINFNIRRGDVTLIDGVQALADHEGTSPDNWVLLDKDVSAGEHVYLVDLINTSSTDTAFVVGYSLIASAVSPNIRKDKKCEVKKCAVRFDTNALYTPSSSTVPAAVLTENSATNFLLPVQSTGPGGGGQAILTINFQFTIASMPWSCGRWFATTENQSQMVHSPG